MADSPGAKRRGEATVYDWIGEIVLVNYTMGPNWGALSDPYEIAHGVLEGREAAFLLQEVSNLGVLLRRPIREEEAWAEPIFMPWGTIHAIEVLEETPEEPEQD